MVCTRVPPLNCALTLPLLCLFWSSLIAASQRFFGSQVHSLHHDFERSVITRTKTVDSICFGSHEINAWYFSPYPVQSSRVLHICEYCLKYVVSAELLTIHYQKCRHLCAPSRSCFRLTWRRCVNECVFVSIGTPRGTKSTGIPAMASLCSRSPAGTRGCTAKTCACWLNFFGPQNDVLRRAALHVLRPLPIQRGR